MKFLVLMGLLLAVGCTKEAPKPEAAKSGEKKTPGEVKLEPAMVKSANIVSVAVESRTQALVLQVNGRLTANEDRTWHVDSFTEGRILKLFANVGDRVTAGQLVAQMHSHEVHESRSEYQRAKTDLAKLQSQRSYAVRTRDRMKRLLELKAASVEQAEHAESQWRDAEAAVKNAQIELERTRVHLVGFLDVPAEDDEEDAVPIKTRNAGTVIKRETSVGSVVKAADGVYVVSDLTSVWMIAALPEDQLGKVRVGMNAQVKVQAYPDEVFAGKIVRLGDQLDVETRTVPVRITLGNQGQKLRPEMYAVAEIGAGGVTNAIVMPQAALQDFNGQAVVFVDLGDGKYVVRPVRTGRVQGASVEVLEGLVAGDRVVSRGAFVLKSQMFKSSLAEE